MRTWVSEGRLIVVTDRVEEFGALTDNPDVLVIGLPEGERYKTPPTILHSRPMA